MCGPFTFASAFERLGQCRIPEVVLQLLYDCFIPMVHFGGKEKTTKEERRGFTGSDGACEERMTAAAGPALPSRLISFTSWPLLWLQFMKQV